ncbi:eukaryotic translation elongation factor 1 epsilon-1-like isoform X2 [Mizuhopecten yessoensis]|uniref:Eukaryotic translation elongation factor 1 epsilon-1 n=1 Tax=Mizuhopecten yessoensis TaxID=6573 RepID=A0A210PNK1_MIZYE|nr:eukaryotic translation elongation factor 1 epsilon-1-like isoform X2 [Mizuhopecten yessoensis]OWF38075.1 Eukaryotic translation elongation factor 1 epsilon-1 [Mizuhopecten yessoensis]
MVDTCDELSRLATYLGVSCGKMSFDGKEKVPVLKVQNNSNPKGLVTVAKYLTRSSQNAKNLLGATPEEKAAVDQWLEYRITRIDRSAQDKDVTNTLKELNHYLADKVYIMGSCLTLADILLYNGLIEIMGGLTFYEKETFMNLSRWFDNIQHQPALRQSLGLVSFQRNQLYKGVKVH